MAAITTNYNTWVMHLHVGKRKEPLTVYPTDDATRVTVMYGKQKWEHILVKQAEQIVGHAIMCANGQVSL
jgi:hypothetical protein